MSKKLAEELAAKVVSSVTRGGVREDILAALLGAVENNVREAVTEAILIAHGNAIVQRDKEWVRELSGEWAPKAGLRTASSPAEVEAEIRAWVAARIQETRQGAYQAGYGDGFGVAVEQGARFGFGAREAGYNGLEEVLKKAKDIKPK